MLKQFKYKDIVWLDLESPAESEVAKIGKEHKIHQLVLGELEQPSERSKVDVYDNLIYLVLHFPCIDCEQSQEIDFVIGKNFIVTAHYQPIGSLENFAKIFETDFLSKNSQEKIHAGFILFYMLKEVYRDTERSLDILNQRLKEVEAQVFSGREREVVATLASINHELLGCQWTLKAHREILGSLASAGEELFGNKFRYYLQAICGEERRVWKMVESSRQTFNDLRNTNASLLSIKTNEIMKLLMVLAFIFLPLNLVAQIFGTSTRLPTFIAPEYDFYFSLVIMLLLLAGMFWLAKKKKWL